MKSNLEKIAESMKIKSNLEKIAEKLLKANPEKLSAPVKVIKTTAAKVERNYFGRKITSKFQEVDQAVKVLAVDKGRPDLVNLENIAAMTNQDKEEISGHFSWFCRKYDFSPYNVHGFNPDFKRSAAAAVYHMV